MLNFTVTSNHVHLLVVDDGDRDTIASLNLSKRKIVIPDDAFATIKESHNHSKRIKAAKRSK